MMGEKIYNITIHDKFGLKSRDHSDNFASKREKERKGQWTISEILKLTSIFLTGCFFYHSMWLRNQVRNKKSISFMTYLEC